MNITHLNTAKNLITKMANGDKWNDIQIRSFVTKVPWNPDNKGFTDDRECLVNILNKTDQNHQFIKIEDLIDSCLSKHIKLLETIHRPMVYDDTIIKAIEFVESADKEPAITECVNDVASYMPSYGLENDNYTLKELIVSYHHVLVADRWDQSLELVYESNDRICYINPYNLADISFSTKSINNKVMQDPKPIKKIIDNDKSECKQTAPCEPSERYGVVEEQSDIAADTREVTTKEVVDDVTEEPDTCTNTDFTFMKLSQATHNDRKLTNEEVANLRDLVNQVKLLVGFQKDEIDRLKAANSQLSNVNELAALDLFKLKQINQKQEENIKILRSTNSQWSNAKELTLMDFFELKKINQANEENIKLLRSANDNQAETIKELQLEAENDNNSLKDQLAIALAEHEKLVNEIDNLKHDTQNLIENSDVLQQTIDRLISDETLLNNTVDRLQDLIRSLTKELDEVAIERNGYKQLLDDYENSLTEIEDVNIGVLNRLATAWNYDREIRSHIIATSTDNVHSQALIKLFDLSHPIVIRNVEDIQMKGRHVDDMELEYLKDRPFIMELSIINPNYFTVTTFDNYYKPCQLICEVPFENCLSNI